MEPVFTSTVMAIEDSWIDYNGHLNMAYYNVLFDRGHDQALALTGLDPETVAQTGLSYMTAEIHVGYVREVFRTDPVQVRLRVLDVDDKRLHTFCELVHATEGWVSAYCETMSLHVDLNVRKVVPFPLETARILAAMKAASDTLPWPEKAGRRIGIVRK
jgi:acyl-CoA thioester hydrolase